MSIDIWLSCTFSTSSLISILHFFLRFDQHSNLNAFVEFFLSSDLPIKKISIEQTKAPISTVLY